MDRARRRRVGRAARAPAEAFGALGQKAARGVRARHADPGDAPRSGRPARLHLDPARSPRPARPRARREAVKCVRRAAGDVVGRKHERPPEQYTVNGLAPQPLTQGSDDGKLDFGFGHIPAGEHLTFWISPQVNPTNVGHRSRRVQLYDGKRLLITVDRTITKI